MIVTIDGPAGAGKSSIAIKVAKHLGFEFLDTGALYRAATLGALQNNIDLEDGNALAGYVCELSITWKNDQVSLNGRTVSNEIRTPKVTKAIRYLADVPAVRDVLSSHQRRIAEGRDIVTEGRDQGTEVFPDADCKVFLTASPEERARRRKAQLAMDGRELSFEEVLETQNRRDLEDSSRDVGRLRAADDAVVVQSDGMTPEEVLQSVLKIVRTAIQRCEIENG